MGDCGEDFQALKQYQKEKKASRKEVNMQIIKNSGIYHNLDGNGSVLCHCGNGRAIFYPSTNKWQYKSCVYYGDASSFLSFIAKVDASY